MSKTLLRGLELIETVGLNGSATVSELARLTGVHVSIVSRTVTALEQDGWLVRVDGKVAPGPRCALLGLTTPASQAVRRAGPLVQAVAGVSGIATAAHALIGGSAMVLASAGTVDMAGGVAGRIPLNVIAGGRAIAAQLTPAQLDQVLPREPYPGREELIAGFQHGSGVHGLLPEHGEETAELPRTRAALNRELERIRATGFAYDSGLLDPGIECIAAPWAAVPGLPSALACFGPRDEVRRAAAVIERCLRAATEPGAGAQDVIDAAGRR